MISASLNRVQRAFVICSPSDIKHAQKEEEVAFLLRETDKEKVTGFLPAQIRTVTSPLSLPLVLRMLKPSGASLCWSKSSAGCAGAELGSLMVQKKSKQSCLNYITHNEIIMRSIGCYIFLALKAFNEIQRDIVLSCFESHFSPKHTNSSQISQLYKLVY